MADPRTLKKVADRVGYLYMNDKAIKAWGTFAEREGAAQTADRPDLANSLQLDKFWREFFTGETDDKPHMPEPDEGNGQGDEQNGKPGEGQGEGDEEFKLPDIGGGQGDDEKSPWEDAPREKSEEELLHELLGDDPGSKPTASGGAQGGQRQEGGQQGKDDRQQGQQGQQAGQQGQEGQQSRQEQQQGDDGQQEQEEPPQEEEHHAKWFSRLLFYCRVKNKRGHHKPTLVVGPSGAGKTHEVEGLAKKLGRRFVAICCTDGMSEEAMIGYPTPNLVTGEQIFHPGPLLQAVEHGWVILLDEADAMNPNTALALNSLLANGWIAVPGYNQGRPVVAHKDFLPVFSMNTFGNGATRQYVGRNAQDSAFLNRMAAQQINIDYDEALEKKICHPEVVKFGHRIRKRCRFTEQGQPRQGFNRDISTRTLLDWSDIMNVPSGNRPTPLHGAIYGFFEDWSEAELSKVGLKRYADTWVIKEERA